jgi:hypothetical protein
MPGDADAIRQALQCTNPRCLCHRQRGRLHCPAHHDEHPDLKLTERDGRVLIHCKAGCSQDAVIEALRARGLWEGTSSLAVTPAESRDLFSKVARFLEGYVVFPSHAAAVATVLWIAHAWAVDAFDVTPYLGISSPEKRSAKTRLLELLELLTPKPWRIVSPSEAVLFRKIAKDRPTLLLDEADTIWRGRSEDLEPLRAVLNAGYRRGAMVPRCVGKATKLVDFPVFCAKALAFIGTAPETIADRSIILRMKRATPAEQRAIRRLRFREAAMEAKPLSDALQTWAQAAVHKLRDARPAVPDALDGRASDSWEPLLAVAEAAGNGWSVHALDAALTLSTGGMRQDDSVGVRLLTDIQRVFRDRQVARLPTPELIEALCAEESSPWGDWYGKRLTPHALARLLRPYGVTSEQWREGERAGIRGYSLESFADAFSRYLPSEPLQALRPASDEKSNLFSEPQQDSPVAVSGNRNPPQQGSLVANVAAPPVRAGEEEGLAFARRWNARVLGRDEGGKR